MIIIGLGNPGEEYAGTRHNTGREAVMMFAKKSDFPDFELDNKSNALVSSKKKITLVLPETFMNKSGSAVVKFVKSMKAAKDLIVVQDDLDLPLGRAKMTFNRSSGGHKGVESVMRALKTEGFWRVRIGISKPAKNGQVKKPAGEDLLNHFIVAKWKPAELDEIKKVWKKVSECLEIATSETPDKAMGFLNSTMH